MSTAAARLKCKNLEEEAEGRTDLTLTGLLIEGFEITLLRYGLGESTRPSVIPAHVIHYPAAWPPRTFPRCASACAVLGSSHVGDHMY
jgi:hypothetical protein